MTSFWLGDLLRDDALRVDLVVLVDLRLVLRGHDALERGIARLIESLVYREQRGQRELDHLDAALDLALGNSLRAVDIEVRHRAHTRQSEQLGDDDADLM